MVDVKNKRCGHPGRIKYPTFGMEGSKAAICAGHKKKVRTFFLVA